MVHFLRKTNQLFFFLNKTEIQEIFSTAFEQAKIFKYLHKALEDVIKQKKINEPNLSSLSIEYAVESDYLAMAEYFKNILHTTLQNKYDDNLPNSYEKTLELQLPKIQISHKFTENKEDAKENEEKKEENPEEFAFDFKNEYEPSLIESVYELVENKDSDSSFMTNPVQIINSPLKRSISAQDKKTQFIVSAVEKKGKVNFKSRAPENYYEMKNAAEEIGIPLLQKSISDISFDFLSFHQTLNADKNVFFFNLKLYF